MEGQTKRKDSVSRRTDGRMDGWLEERIADWTEGCGRLEEIVQAAGEERGKKAKKHINRRTEQREGVRQTVL